MALHIYTKIEDVPKELSVIRVNDLFFNQKVVLNDTEYVRYILRKIDAAKYHTGLTVIGRTPALGGLNKSVLSSGCKTVLNIVHYPEGYCFALDECGNNALEIIVRMTEGNVLWCNPAVVISGDDKCDIICNGERYSSIYEFLDSRK